MKLDAVLSKLFPGIDFENECLLQENETGPYIAKWRRAEKQPTLEELKALWPTVQTELTNAELVKKTLEDQQAAGIIEAKRAYARMQTIIDSVDTATVAQLRLAIKEMARDIQHLIRAAVK